MQAATGGEAGLSLVVLAISETLTSFVSIVMTAVGYNSTGQYPPLIHPRRGFKVCLIAAKSTQLRKPHA
jgi:hypothetical protein